MEIIKYLQMEHCRHLIPFFLKRLFLVGSFLLSFASFSLAQSSSSLGHIHLAGADSTKVASSLSSPVSPPWQQLLSELSEMEDFENTAWEDYEEDLEELSQHPMNLNAASREDLERLPFLTASQVENILYYNYRYGGLKTMGELVLIPSISWYQRQLMGYFFYVADVQQKQGFPTLRNIAKYGKHEVMGMLKVPFYERKGDVMGEDGKSNDGYMGYRYKHNVRYQFRYGDYVKLGFVGAQDAGEPFGAGKNNLGYDFYSFYLQVRKLGRWKNITLGRYRLHEGLGLILNNDFSFGKLSVLSSMGRSSNVIKVHSSRSSANYLQGVAATYTLAKGLDLTGFFSYRKIDATLSGAGGIKTILKTGLHRTIKEIQKQDVASNTLVGGNISYRSNGWHVGATGFFTSFSHPLTPNKTELYKRFYPQGYEFWNASVDYGYTSHRWTIAGETATGNSNAIATLNSASYLFTDHFSLMALQRFYSARYYSLFSNSFSEGSSVQDENGVYLGFTWNPASRWSLTAYSDFAYFVWPKYHTQESTRSWDNLLSILYHPSKSCTLGARVRYKERAGTITERLRFYASITGLNWSSKTSLDYTISKQKATGNDEDADYEESNPSRGYLLDESFGWRWRWLKLSGAFGYFHTHDYDSRIYAYEPGLLYQMSFGSYYGEGIRYALVARSEIGKHLLLIMKLGTTDYFDRNHISSGLQEISRSSQTDLEIQVKWKF